MPRNKNKPTPSVEEEKSGVNDKEDHDKGSAEVEKPVAASDSSADRNVQPSKSAATRARDEPPEAAETLRLLAAEFVFKQVEIPGKGQGLVATAQLPAGTIVVQESPLITAEGVGEDIFPHHGIFAYDVEEIVAKFRRLTCKQKDQVLSLYDPGPSSKKDLAVEMWSFLNRSFTFADETEKKAVRIFEANCFGLDCDDGGCGLYKTISRINHSCAPNVVCLDKSKVVKQVRVVRKIKEGEEILVKYFPGFLPESKNDRQKMLRPWNFICICEVCSLTGDKLIENEKARKRLRELHEVLYANEPVDNEQALKAVKEKWKIMKTMRKEMIVQLPFAMLQCCYIAALCKLPSSSSAELMKKAKEMSELFGDFHVESYMNVEKMIKEIRR